MSALFWRNSTFAENMEKKQSGKNRKNNFFDFTVCAVNSPDVFHERFKHHHLNFFLGPTTAAPNPTDTALVQMWGI